MDTVLERIERVPGSAVFDGECAFRGIGNVASPTLILDCRCQHGACSEDAETGREAEKAA
jgi:hypothetical protein